MADGALIREQRPSLYLYRLVAGERAQVGLAACVHVSDYERGVIRKHETTRPDKEDDRTRHALALGAHAEPVLLLYRDRVEIDRLAGREVERAPLLDVAAADGVRHTMWAVAEPAPWVEAFGAVGRAYVADGHHRSASAWRAARQLRSEGANAPGDEEHNWFMAVLFPASQLRILPYHRLVRDLGGRTPREILERLGQVGDLSVTDTPVPPGRGVFCLYLERRWYRLGLPPTSIDRGDPVRSLDVWLLQERVLGPILGIDDPRTDPRIDFVGGIRGTGELERRVDSGEAALAVSVHPTTVEQLMAAADAGRDHAAQEHLVRAQARQRPARPPLCLTPSGPLWVDAPQGVFLRIPGDAPPAPRRLPCGKTVVYSRRTSSRDSARSTALDRRSGESRRRGPPRHAPG